MTRSAPPNSPMLPLNELFETVQGEATYTGMPSVFVRLQGCDVGCPWCDTKHTWAVDPLKKVGLEEVLGKDHDSDSYNLIGPGHLIELISMHKARHVVITGGEPCMHDLGPLSFGLIARGFSVQVETSGTQPIRIDDRAFVTLSPKIDMPGGFVVRGDAIARANEIKMPVGKPDDIDKLMKLLAKLDMVDRPPSGVWLQPLSQSEKATALCVREATELGFRISIQTHKYLGVR